MLIKVCGMREPENIRAVAELGVDMIGFVFYPESPRFVKMISSRAGIIPDYSEERYRRSKGEESPESDVRKGFQRVGVFVDDMPQSIVTRIYNYGLDYVQLHGEELPVMIDNLRRTVDPDIHPGIRIIKSLQVGCVEDVEKWHPYRGHADMLLFDTRCKEHGGSGKKFDWNILEAYDGDIPFLIGGGINIDDAERVKSFRHPMFAGVDLNSCFETEPGVKDVEKLKAFMQALGR